MIIKIVEFSALTTNIRRVMRADDAAEYGLNKTNCNLIIHR